MSRSTTLIIIGLVVLLAPFLGLYASFVAFVEAICGIVLVGLGLHARSMLARASREATPISSAQAAPMMAEAPAAPMPPADETPHLSPIA